MYSGLNGALGWATCNEQANVKQSENKCLVKE